MTVEPASDELIAEIEDNTFDWDWTPLDPKAFTRTDVCVGHIAALIARIRQAEAEREAALARIKVMDEPAAWLFEIDHGHDYGPFPELAFSEDAFSKNVVSKQPLYLAARAARKEPTDVRTDTKPKT